MLAKEEMEPCWVLWTCLKRRTEPHKCWWDIQPSVRRTDIWVHSHLCWKLVKLIVWQRVGQLILAGPWLLTPLQKDVQSHNWLTGRNNVIRLLKKQLLEQKCVMLQ
jgi:hypothetical protein